MSNAEETIGTRPNEMCSKCKGACCKALPGSVFFDDIKEPIVDTITEMLRGGYYSIDAWDGDVFSGTKYSCYYLRPATVGSKDVFDLSWGGRCIFLSKEGCTLSWEERPRGCRLLVPKTLPGGKCGLPENLGGTSCKNAAAKNWYDHSEMLQEIGNIIVQERKEVKA